MTAVETVALLFAGTGSFSVPLSIELLLTPTVLLIIPAVVGRTTIVTVLGEFFASVPRLQVTLPADCEHAPCVDVAEMKLTPAGSTSVTVTPVAVDRPLLMTLAV
jgi:hypothetical protein